MTYFLRDSFIFRLRPRHLGRYRRIAEVLRAAWLRRRPQTKLGFDERLRLPRRILRRGRRSACRPCRLAGAGGVGAAFIELGREFASTRPEVLCRRRYWPN